MARYPAPVDSGSRGRLCCRTHKHPWAALEEGSTLSEDTHVHSHHGSVDEIAILKAFHGHLGPYVFAGMRMGRYALDRLSADPHFGVEADVFCPDAPPPSCALDGIQFSTGCTMGKRNIRHHVSEGVAARFLNRKSGETLCVRLRPAALALALEEMRLHNDEAGARVIESMSDEELLEDIADL